MADRARFGRQRRATAVFLGILLLGGCWKGRSGETVVFSGSTMGTIYSIKLSSLPSAVDYEDLRTDIQKRLDEIERLMSSHLPSSEISLFNAHRGTDWFALSPPTMRVVRQALLVARQSDGAFDPTVGNLVEAWGFGSGSRKDRLPSAATIRSALRKTGYGKLTVHENRDLLKKGNPDVALDLSAIAKGFAVDSVARLLEERGFADYLAEVGGEIRARGTKRRNRPWIIAIEKPVLDRREIYRTLSIGRNGMATSGDYRNFFSVGGKRYSHVMDPKTGYPIVHDTGSVTVIHPSCAAADAWATALLVLGWEKGYEVAVRNGLSALFVYRIGSDLKDRGTPGFLRYVEKRPAAGGGAGVTKAAPE